MTMSPVDPTLSLQNLSNQEMAQRKMQIDALQKSLNAGPDEKARLREACQGFETVFLNKMWEQMRKNVNKEGYLHSKDEETYQSMFDQEFSKKMAEAGGIGLGDMLYDQLSQRLSESSRTNSPGVNPTSPIISSGSSPKNINFSMNRQEIKPLRQGKTPMPLHAASDIKPINRNPFAPEVSDIDFEALSQSQLQDELNGTESISQNSGSNPVGNLQGAEAAILDAALLAASQNNAAVDNRVQSATLKDESEENQVIAANTLPDFVMPVDGEVVTPFGWMIDADGTRTWHQGLDLAAKEGQGVRAGMDGKLSFVGEHPSYGSLVIMEHDNGWRSYYSNAKSIGGKVGDTVKSGTEFARVTAQPEEAAAHLHFELRRGELAVNPDNNARLMAQR